jgi:septal ring factor EnvC (AmiA/AmiB activator)
MFQEFGAVGDRLEEKGEALQATRARLSSKENELAAMRRELTEQRLKFANRVHDLRRKKQATREELAALEKSIDRLKSRLGSMDSRAFSSLKGELPWPAQGKVVKEYAKGDGKFQDGIGFSLAEGTGVQAVSWGDVAYNDTLRGFGQVVIIYHGQDYYSLYAFLSRTNVRSGQKVEKGEVIGHAGYFPAAQGPGLYFELRRKQSTVDPRLWMAKQE